MPLKTCIQLCRQWRGSNVLNVEESIRLSRVTLEELHAYLAERSPIDAETRERLRAYADSVDEAVPSGWVRVRV